MDTNAPLISIINFKSRNSVGTSHFAALFFPFHNLTLFSFCNLMEIFLTNFFGCELGFG